MRRIALLGGTFDPIHIGHLAIAEDVRVAVDAACVLFIPAAQQPFKAGARTTPAAHRLAMTQLATADNAGFAVSDIEIRRGGLSYTVDTVDELRTSYPGDELLFIVGADAAADLPRWHAVERLLSLCRIVLVDRPGYSVDLDTLYAQLPAARERILRVAGPALTISASELRARMAEGRPVRYQLLPPVLRYIEAQRLYREPADAPA